VELQATSASSLIAPAGVAIMSVTLTSKERASIAFAACAHCGRVERRTFSP
jgi:hypothetical protein